MFFDNRDYFNYVQTCREEGITVPIIPGLKILLAKNNMNSLPRNFHISIPEELAEEVAAARPEQVMEIGVNWAVKQFEDLLNHKVPAVHFYIMQDSTPIKMLMNKIKL
jgi:methylenetetrahydrofolate reductase (NADPH)